MPIITLTNDDDIFAITDPFGGPYTVNGLRGDDIITGNTSDDTLNGNQGDDTLTGAGGNDNLNGGSGNDTIYVTGTFDSTTDFTGFSVVHGDAGADHIIAGNGIQHANADIFGDAGNDLIDANVNVGDYFISGGNGADEIHTGFTSSTATFEVEGGEGSDLIAGVGGNNHFSGGDGNDTLSGTFGTFDLEGGDGNDILLLGSFANGTLDGGDGNDTMTAVAQRDQFIMHGGNGNDYMEGIGNFSLIDEQFFGEAGNDTIISLGGNDILDGGTGRDHLQGGDGNDTLTGGAGKDAFIFIDRAEGGTTSFTDTITDFTHQDWIEMVGLGLTFDDLSIIQGATGTEIQYVDGAAITNTIVLTGVDSTTMEASDFYFA